MLITPYLINKKTGALYELAYYEQSVNRIDDGQSGYINYDSKNLLPKEIVDNFYKKINVNMKD